MDAGWCADAARGYRLDADGAAAIVGAVLVAVAGWQAASLKVGLVVCAGFAALACVLTAASSAVVYAGAPITLARWFPLRHAVLAWRGPATRRASSCSRSASAASSSSASGRCRRACCDQFSLQLSAGGADMFLIDILPAQVAQRSAPSWPTARLPAPPDPKVIPVLRARVIGVRGRETTLGSFDDVRREGGLGREFTITYRDRTRAERDARRGALLERDGPLPESAAMGEVSIENSIHERYRIDVGDTMRFDIAGRPVDARVTSIRDVEWRDARSGGFMFVFRPGPFAHAPQTCDWHFQGARGSPRRAAGSSAIWWRSFPTSRSSTCARCWRRSSR